MEEEEEDYSQYDNYKTDESIKRYCTPKVVGLSPAKLVTLGYEFAAGHSISSDSIELLQVKTLMFLFTKDL